jgi:glutamine synthetase
MAVSFAPVVFAGRVGNGDHLHLSLWNRRGRNVFDGGDGPEGMTRQAESFAAGVLASLSAIVGVSCPSVVSYLRLQPHRWSGPWACWGLENREAGLRFVTGMRGDRRAEANLEIKPVDGSANPYLALGAIVAAGLDGLERDLRLPEPVTVDPASLSAAERRKRKVEQLPSSLDAAIAELERSSVLREAMGDMLFDSFVATRKGELAAFEGLDDDAVVRAHRWRY